ncbi:Bikaverin cluster transcription factor bik5 like protein [Verticillium longisporum]|uniref:Bikaverin cluster transcription factor bik5 like protein n=1 Tax=Verticillium longisporum TaxID=100787 RepID=A0A8I3AIC6_VERLO|nr:Bikaverin cluster transcription factor bik5 like protein [Verticillium longisporum]
MADDTQDASARPTSKPVQWTCLACRRRKIKCKVVHRPHPVRKADSGPGAIGDKVNPCTNCVKTNTECVTPRSGRASAKAPRRVDLRRRFVERTTELEGALQSIDSVHRSGSSESPARCDAIAQHAHEADEAELFRRWRKVWHFNYSSGRRGSAAASLWGQAALLGLLPALGWVDPRQAGVESSLDKLFVGSTESQYVNTCLLDVLEQEVGNLNGDVELAGGYDHAPKNGGCCVHSASCNSRDTRLRLDLLERLWSRFQVRVDPVIKVLHVPAVDSVVNTAISVKPVSRDAEALVWAISYVAIRSLTPQECLDEFGESHEALSAYHRLGCEQASARAGFLERTNLTTMQAYVLYLAGLRTEDSPRVLWSLIGLAIRASQSFGLHKDGVHWGLPPFEIEMRRRLWWQLCALDSRISEDNGRAPQTAEMQFDTQMPLNVNIEDLTYNMKELPESRIGLTEMTMSLIQFELNNTLRRVLRNWYGIDGGETPPDILATSTAKEKEDWVVQGLRRLEQTYLDPLEESSPNAWVAAAQVRLLMASLWLMVFCPTPMSEARTDQSDYIAGKLFVTSIEAIEESNKLNGDPRARQWQWYLRLSLQWHSSVFVLSELGRNWKGTLVDRAWGAIEEMVRVRFQGNENGTRHHVLLWQHIRRLLIKARMTREKKFLEDSRLRSSELSPLASHRAIDELLASEDGVRSSA